MLFDVVVVAVAVVVVDLFGFVSPCLHLIDFYNNIHNNINNNNNNNNTNNNNNNNTNNNFNNRDLSYNRVRGSIPNSNGFVSMVEMFVVVVCFLCCLLFVVCCCDWLLFRQTQ